MRQTRVSSGRRDNVRTDSWTNLDRHQMGCIHIVRRLRRANQVTPSVHQMLKVRTSNQLTYGRVVYLSISHPKILSPHLAGAIPSEALGCKRGAQLPGDEPREADFTTTGKGTSTIRFVLASRSISIRHLVELHNEM